MSKVIRYFPELEGDEQLAVARILTDLSEEQTEQFSRVYRSRRKDPQTTLLLTLLGLVVVAGVQRFYLGQVGMGLLYLFTGGLCVVGTIVDALNHRKLAAEFNVRTAREVAELVRGALPSGDAPMQLR